MNTVWLHWDGGKKLKKINKKTKKDKKKPMEGLCPGSALPPPKLYKFS